MGPFALVVSQHVIWYTVNGDEMENMNIHSLYNHPSALAISKRFRTVINGEQEEDGSWIDYRIPYSAFPGRLGAENYYRIYDGRFLWNMTRYLLADNSNGEAVTSLKNLLRGY